MKQLAIGVAILALMAIAFAFGWLSKIVIAGVNAATVLQSMTIIVTVSLAVWTYRVTKKKEAAARLFTQKADVYLPLVEELKRAHLAGKNGNPDLDQEALAKALTDIQFKAIVWGDQEFLRALIEFSESRDGDSEDVSFGRVAKLYEQMRKELGHHDKRGVGYDVLELLIIADERHLIRSMKERFLQTR